jgi:hypothetical protein
MTPALGCRENDDAELRDAFDVTMKGPAFLAEIAKKGMQIDATGGEEVTNVLAKTYASRCWRLRRDRRQLSRGQTC